MAFNFELSVSVIIATPEMSLTSIPCNLIKSSLTLALTVTQLSRLSIVVGLQLHLIKLLKMPLMKCLKMAQL